MDKTVQTLDNDLNKPIKVFIDHVLDNPIPPTPCYQSIESLYYPQPIQNQRTLYFPFGACYLKYVI